MSQTTPFHNKDGVLEFPYRPLRDLVFVFPTPPPEKLGRENLIHIPDRFRKKHQDGTGVVLAIGPGYQNNRGKWECLPPRDLVPGVRVRFDTLVPWGIIVEDSNGEHHYVFICGIADIFGMVEERRE